MSTTRRRTALLAVLGTVALTAACGGGTPGPGTTSTTPAPGTTSAHPTTAPPTSPAPTPTVTKTVTVTPSGLPGLPVAGPAAGTRVMVFGVTAGDTLRLRARPGTDATVLTGIAPVEEHAVATGSARRVGSTTWWRLRVHGTTGWASARYLSQPADTGDITSEVVRALGGRLPTEETMLDLGMTVARTRASQEPRSDLVVAVRPTVGDLGEITIDVVGIGDDAIAGERLHVFGTPGVESFTLKSVESTPMCLRGVGNGRCV